MFRPQSGKVRSLRKRLAACKEVFKIILMRRKNRETVAYGYRWVMECVWVEVVAFSSYLRQGCWNVTDETFWCFYIPYNAKDVHFGHRNLHLRVCVTWIGYNISPWLTQSILCPPLVVETNLLFRYFMFYRNYSKRIVSDRETRSGSQFTPKSRGKGRLRLFHPQRITQR